MMGNYHVRFGNETLFSDGVKYLIRGRCFSFIIHRLVWCFNDRAISFRQVRYPPEKPEVRRSTPLANCFIMW